ncbi:MAG: tetratricopeptide repeat protein [Candidatus Melainabacteria bacterium]|nr:tetratricopeptide repeat protein [Candidatus Melainabacteria bacterium]
MIRFTKLLVLLFLLPVSAASSANSDVSRPIFRQAPIEVMNIYWKCGELVRNGRSEEAVDLYKNGLAKYPHQELLSSELGDLYRKLGRLKEARMVIEEFMSSERSTLKFFPRCSERANLVLADVYEDLHKIDLADTCHKQALTCATETYTRAKCWLEYAEFLDRNNRKKDAQMARENYRRCMHLLPNEAAF